MSTLQNIYQKMVPSMEPASASQSSHGTVWPDAPRQISREVAHDLNNILTIINGYAERMILKHGENSALRPDLQIISENARRAAQVIRRATPQPAPPQPARVAA